MPWSSWINAEIYDRFVRERRIYDWLNTHLVRLADLRLARRILDVGCGTGATALACLGKMDSGAELVGIDSSEEMIGVARSNALDPRARFEVLPAAAADRLDGTFDLIQIGQELIAALIVLAPDVGQIHLPGGAVEQAHAEVAFEIGNLLADHRLAAKLLLNARCRCGCQPRGVACCCWPLTTAELER